MSKFLQKKISTFIIFIDYYYTESLDQHSNEYRCLQIILFDYSIGISIRNVRSNDD